MSVLPLGPPHWLLEPVLGYPPAISPADSVVQMVGILAKVVCLFIFISLLFFFVNLNN